MSNASLSIVPGVPGGRDSVDEACGRRPTSLAGLCGERGWSRSGMAGVGLPYRRGGFIAGTASSLDVGVLLGEAPPPTVVQRWDSRVQLTGAWVGWALPRPGP